MAKNKLLNKKRLSDSFEKLMAEVKNLVREFYQNERNSLKLNCETKTLDCIKYIEKNENTSPQVIGENSDANSGDSNDLSD